jgi:hypothetical protein
MTNKKYPAEWLERVPAEVFYSPRPGEVRIILYPGNGRAFGGVPRDLPVRQIPRELRMPNTTLWVELDDDLNVVEVWRRDE